MTGDTARIDIAELEKLAEATTHFVRLAEAAKSSTVVLKAGSIGDDTIETLNHAIEASKHAVFQAQRRN